MKASHLLILLFAICLSLIVNLRVYANPIDILTEAELHLSLTDVESKIEVTLGGHSVSSMNEWILKRIDEGHVQFKRQDWPELFFELNLTEKVLHLVGQGVFGKEGGIKAPSMVRKIEQDANGKFHLKLVPVVLSCNLTSKQVSLKYQILDLATAESFSLFKIDDHTVQVKHKSWGEQFWQADSDQQKVWSSSGPFGVRATAQKLVNGATPIKVDFSYPSVAAAPPSKRKLPQSAQVKTEPPLVIQLGWPVDQALEGDEQPPPSAWQEAQKALYRQVVTDGSYDTLLIPVQVNGYAIDRPGRSLLTRFIHQRLIESGFKLPNLSVVTRALGERARTYSQNEIISLAEELEVEQILIPAIGHDGDKHLMFSMMRLRADENDRFDPTQNAAQASRDELAFSDEQLPFMVALPEIDPLLQKLGVALTEPQPEPLVERYEPLTLPPTPAELFALNDPSVLANAYFMQLCAFLHPKHTVAEEGLFERSLVAAWRLPEQHPERNLLIARSLLHLHRRPAAIKFLGQAKSTSEKTFLALLNGNLNDVQQLRGNIESPLKKLLADIEYKDLLWSFTRRALEEEPIAEIIAPYQQWEPLLTRRLLDNWIWKSQPNIIIKNLLDEAFPIAGFTAESLLTSQLALGESPFQGATVELAAYEHYRQILTTDGGQLFPADDGTKLRKSDYLDLLYLTSEANLIDAVAKIVLLKGLADRGLEKLRDYSAIYEGHPYLTYLKSEALKIKAQGSRKTEKNQLNKEEAKLRELSAYWMQGQATGHKLLLFKNDFPKRPYWISGLDRFAALENSLLYTHDNFKIVQALYNFYNNPGREEKLATVLEQLETRFIGHPERQNLLAQICERKGDLDAAERYYREIIALLPREWRPRQELAEMLIRQDRLEEADELMSNYVPFAEPDSDEGVGLSHDAYNAGKLFYQLGLVERATGYYQIAQSYQTGSGSEMYSAVLISLIEHDFQGAAEHVLRHVRRYKAGYSYADYIKYLHLFGQHEQAWAIFNNLPPAKVSADSWRAALYGMRMEGKTEKQIDAWFAQRSEQAESAEFVMLRLIDRDGRFDQGYLTAVQDRLKKQFIDIYLSCKQQLYEENHHFSRVSSGVHYHRNFLPYLAIHYDHFGRQELFAKQLQEFIARFGRCYETYLAEGVRAGLQGDPEAAVGLIRKAWLHIPGQEKPFLPPLYQLAEICEWLYQSKKDSRYREAAVHYAELQNQQAPLCAWPYALQAQYEKNPQERSNLLGTALFLDKNSAWIKAFNAEEREQAKKNFELDKFLNGQHKSKPHKEV